MRVINHAEADSGQRGYARIQTRYKPLAAWQRQIGRMNGAEHAWSMRALQARVSHKEGGLPTRPNYSCGIRRKKRRRASSERHLTEKRMGAPLESYSFKRIGELSDVVFNHRPLLIHIRNRSIGRVVPLSDIRRRRNFKRFSVHVHWPSSELRVLY